MVKINWHFVQDMGLAILALAQRNGDEGAPYLDVQRLTDGEVA
jgi:hypothetical protein